MNRKDILNINKIIPAIILLGIAAFTIISSLPKKNIPAGTPLYEKNEFGYRRVHIAKQKTTAIIKTIERPYVKASIAKPASQLWIRQNKRVQITKFPTKLLFHTKAGILQRETTPFKEKINQEFFKDAKKKRRLGFTSYSSYFIFSLFILLLLLLGAKQKLLKNSSAVVTGAALLFFAIYTAGIVKSQKKSSALICRKALQKIQVKKSILFCPNRQVEESAHAIKGNRVKTIITRFPARIRGSYALWHKKPAYGWKQLSAGKKYNLYYRP